MYKSTYLTLSIFINQSWTLILYDEVENAFKNYIVVAWFPTKLNTVSIFDYESEHNVKTDCNLQFNVNYYSLFFKRFRKPGYIYITNYRSADLNVWYII